MFTGYYNYIFCGVLNTPCLHYVTANAKTMWTYLFTKRAEIQLTTYPVY